MKKSIFAFALAMMLVASSCGQAPTNTPSTAEQPQSQAQASSEQAQSDAKPVTFVWVDDQYAETDEANRKKFVLEPFAEKFPNIQIDYRPITDTTKEIRIQLAAGAGPDLMSLESPSDALELLADGRVIDLTPYAEKHNWNDAIFSWALNVATSSDGKLACIPNSWEGMVMYWNQDILDKEGWAVPKNYDDILKINEQVRERGYVAVMHQGTSGVPRLNEWWQSTLFGAYAGGAATKKLLRGEIGFADEPIKGMFARDVEIWGNGVLGNKDTAAITRDDTRALFRAGQLPLHIEGSWYISQLMDSDMNFGVGTLPSFRSDLPEADFPLAIGSAFAVNSAASPEQQDAIAELINFIFTEKDLHVKAIEAGMQPLPIDIDESKFSANMHPQNKEMLTLLNDKMAKSEVSYCTWTFFPQEARIYLYENIDDVFLGSKTLDDYLAGAQVKLDEARAAGKVLALP